MQGQLTNVSCLMGLIIIFLMAAFLNVNYSWIAGIIALLVILIIRNSRAEVPWKIELLLAVLSWICILGSLMLFTGIL